MKKIILLLMAFIAITAWPASAYEYQDTVKVGLKFGFSAPSSVTVSCDDAFAVFDEMSGNLIAEFGYGSIKIEKGPTGFISQDAFVNYNTSSISIKPLGDSPIALDGVKYRGYLLINRLEASDMTVINVVNIEQYLSSLLGKEMSASWPQEALKAQSIAARNYVLCNNTKHANYGFEVCATTDCQVYGGIASEDERTIAAVEATKGLVATYEGKIVQLFYFATSGGKTEDVENVWSSKIDYLRAVDDPYEDPNKASRYNWTQELTPQEVNERLIAKGIDIGDIEDIKVISTSDSGRVLKLTFYGSDGEKSVEKEKARTTLGTDIMYSQWFEVDHVGDESKMEFYTVNGLASENPVATTASEIALVEDTYILSADGVSQKPLVKEEGPEKYVFTGHGYGHGVGMSQWGAYGMANAGFTFDEILKHYFTGIEIE